MQNWLKNIVSITEYERAYLNKDLNINGFPFYVTLKDLKSQYIETNDIFAKLLDYKNGSDLRGLYDADIWPVGFNTLKLNEQKVIHKKELLTFNETVMNKNTKVDAICYKTPLMSSKKIIGTICLFVISKKTDLTKQQLDISFLTRRQSECLSNLVQGMTLKEIGNTLGLSCRTVEHYLNHIKQKLNCKSRTELIKKAIDIGL